MTSKVYSVDIDDFDSSPAINQWLISGSRKRRPGFIRFSFCSTAASGPLPGSSGASTGPYKPRPAFARSTYQPLVDGWRRVKVINVSTVQFHYHEVSQGVTVHFGSPVSLHTFN